MRLRKNIPSGSKTTVYAENATNTTRGNFPRGNLKEEVTMSDNFAGNEKRNFLRFGFEKPLHYSLVTSPKDKNMFSSLVKAISKNLSASGMLFISKADKVPEISSLIMLDIDYKTANVCHEIDQRAFIQNNKLLGRVVRIEDNEDGTCGVGVAFVTKSERLAEDVKKLIQ